MNKILRLLKNVHAKSKTKINANVSSDTRSFKITTPESPIITLSSVNAILLEISSVSSELEQDQFLSNVIAIIHAHVEIYFIGFYLLDLEKECVAFRAGSGQAGEYLRSSGHYFPIKASRVEKVVLANKIHLMSSEILTYSLPEEPWWSLDIKFAANEGLNYVSPLLPETRWELFLPLRDQEKAMGIVWINTAEISGFSIEDIIYFQLLADQIAGRLRSLSD